MSRDGAMLRFALPDGHCYLGTDPIGSFSRVPEKSAFPPPPPGHYELRGTADLSGHGRAALYLLQYDDSEQLARTSTALRPGPFRLRFAVTAACRRILVAVRLSGVGELRLSPLQLQTDACESLADELARIDGAQPRTRVFIAGCPRSGTTLLLNMMRCFDNVAVDLSERSYDHFALLESDAPVQVLKRTGHCYDTLTAAPSAISIIYLVRHPFDVLTSRHRGDLAKGYFTTVEEWIAEYRAFVALRELRADSGLLVLRYEDLVQEADIVQAKIQRWLSGTPMHARLPFTRFHEIARDDETLYQVALSGVRPVDTSSIAKWRHDEALRQDLQQLVAKAPAEIAAFMKAFGYEGEL